MSSIRRLGSTAAQAGDVTQFSTMPEPYRGSVTLSRNKISIYVFIPLDGFAGRDAGHDRRRQVASRPYPARRLPASADAAAAAFSAFRRTHFG